MNVPDATAGILVGLASGVSSVLGAIAGES